MANFIAVLILLGLVTVVGHGIWVFVAFLIRDPARKDRQPPPPTATEPPPLSGRALVLADLVATERQVWHFYNSHAIDAATRDKLLEGYRSSGAGEPNR
jgi:hypothetical protein